MHHVGVPVSNLERSVKWYEEALGIISSGVTIAGDNPALGALMEIEDPSMRATVVLAGDKRAARTRPVRPSGIQALHRTRQRRGDDSPLFRGGRQPGRADFADGTDGQRFVGAGPDSDRGLAVVAGTTTASPRS